MWLDKVPVIIVCAGDFIAQSAGLKPKKSDDKQDYDVYLINLLQYIAYQFSIVLVLLSVNKACRVSSFSLFIFLSFMYH